jgi:radical SAM superfamily enzyme YgiQ (UPF0313 family)
MRYNHALFLNPYAASQTKTTSITGLFPPTGLEYVATSARDLVEKLTLLDLRYESDLSNTDKLLDFIRKEIDVICVGIGWDKEFKEVCDLLNLMPDTTPLIVGGYKATEQVEELFKQCPAIDIIVRGEGEETIREILAGEQRETILGISYRENGKIVHNENRPLPEADIILSPDRSLRRYDYRVALYGKNITQLTYDTVLGARGCPFNCKFCTFSLNPLGQKRTYSARSVESVIQEIESITADIILFSDDNFAVNVTRAKEICDAIVVHKIKKRFLAQTRIEITKHPELLEKMVAAGFKILLLGIESPHDHILAQLNKGFDSDTVRQSFTVFRKYPIFYHGYFIYGNIGETEAEMLYIAQFAREIGVDTIACNKLRVNKFSPIKEVVEKTPGYHVTLKGEVYSDTYSHTVLKKINKKIKASFYNPWKILKIVKKFLETKFLTSREIFPLLGVTPFLLGGFITREIEKTASRLSLKRIVKNDARKKRNISERLRKT